MIAYLGWGSLIWHPGQLAARIGSWRSKGRYLPIEFCRQSNNGRLTLVITPSANPAQVLWADAGTDDESAAIRALREREGCIAADIHRLSFSSDAVAAPLGIADWMRTAKVSTAIWTGLPPRFGGHDHVVPSAQSAVDYLKSLQGTCYEIAKEYVCRTPAQVRTAFRDVFESELGWLPTHRTESIA
jgi:hypothetical protein